MKKSNLKTFFADVCAAYTLICLFIVTAESFVRGSLNKDHFNILLAFILTTIAVGTLYLYPLFEKLSTLTIVLLQYAIAMGSVLLIVKLSSFFIEIHPDGYRDIFVSFTVPYLIGATIFYYHIKKSVKKQNELLDFIKSKKDNLNV